MQDKNLCILNNGSSTRIGYNSESAIDITLCSSVLTRILYWTVSTSPGDSDHCPIWITLLNQNIQDNEQTIRCNYKRADWTKYSNDEVWMNTPDIGVSLTMNCQF